VHPVVVSRAFERFTRDQRPTLLLLFDAIFVLRLVDELFLQALLFSISVGFLLVRYLRLFVEFRFSIFVRTENAFVCLMVVSKVFMLSRKTTYIGHALFFVILTGVTIPLVCLARIIDSVARLVNS
jgi:hypothetical protein